MGERLRASGVDRDATDVRLKSGVEATGNLENEMGGLPEVVTGMHCALYNRTQVW